ncbi:hypothetical protein Celal_3797 [Cellulophaga algicola DSM 14237]|uniref:Uncharacterized protein n=1 Tax=Cellulophaga algicola (strain DSM 14237 / IC166 / ACAM 630) TaxID=688270 RepID=E6XBD3_CELAD|nr:MULTISPECIES: hypothetical protein [Cellulophaga]ADV51046.1 hypothetical protein Celal_3797 [Cellulophaga algicola DSM 14237]
MKRLLKGILKAILVLLGLMIAVFAIVYFVYNEKVPVGENPQEADALAYKMLNAINQKAYEDTRYLEWSFAGGGHRYKWDKQKGLVVVKWDNYSVNLNLNDTYLSEVTKNNAEVTAKEARDTFHIAWEYFNNDSFWLVAPFKVFDEGTTRSLVTLEDGSQGLMISYNSGGSTPGDSYVWKLNEEGFPVNYKMWVSIIPIGGLEATWEGWKTMENGVSLPASHKIGPISLSMGEVRAYN